MLLAEELDDFLICFENSTSLAARPSFVSLTISSRSCAESCQQIRSSYFVAMGAMWQSDRRPRAIEERHNTKRFRDVATIDLQALRTRWRNHDRSFHTRAGEPFLNLEPF